MVMMQIVAKENKYNICQIKTYKTKTDLEIFTSILFYYIPLPTYIFIFLIKSIIIQTHN